MTSASPPIRFWGASAILSVAADDAERIDKALTRRTADVRAFLARAGITTDDAAAAMDLGPEVVASVLDAPLPPPAIMLDAEDALVADARDAALRAAADRLADPRWPAGTLRLVRLPSAEPAAARALLDTAGGRQPDAIVLPKAEDPAAIDAVAQVVADGPHLIPLVETPRGVAAALELADAAGGRLAGLMFGAVDYGAALGLSVGSESGPAPMATWARRVVVNAAAAAGVPAFDGMTTRYPIAPRGASATAARAAVLDGLAAVAAATAIAAADGMSGKLVGHPAQTVAVVAAFRGATDPAELDRLVDDVAAFAAMTARGTGVGAQDGRMWDGATDRLRRTQLRRAAARGILEPTRALALGVITPSEADDLTHHGSLA